MVEASMLAMMAVSCWTTDGAAHTTVSGSLGDKGATRIHTSCNES